MTDSDPAPFTKQHWAKTRNNKEGKADMQPDWTKKAAKAIPKEGFLEGTGRCRPIFPRAPACYGFTIIAKIRPGAEQTIRSYQKGIEETIAGLPDALILRVARHNCENGGPRRTIRPFHKSKAAGSPPEWRPAAPVGVRVSSPAGRA